MNEDNLGFCPALQGCCRVFHKLWGRDFIATRWFFMLYEDIAVVPSTTVKKKSLIYKLPIPRVVNESAGKQEGLLFDHPFLG